MGNDEASSFRFFAVSECVCWNFFGDIYLLLEILAPFGHDFNTKIWAHHICLFFSFCFSIHVYWFLYTSILNCRTGIYFSTELICLQSEFFALMCRPFLCTYFLVEAFLRWLLSILLKSGSFLLTQQIFFWWKPHGSCSATEIGDFKYFFVITI